MYYTETFEDTTIGICSCFTLMNPDELGDQYIDSAPIDNETLQIPREGLGAAFAWWCDGITYTVIRPQSFILVLI